MVSASKPFASRFLRLSRLLRFDLALSACRDALFDGAGEDLTFKSDNEPFKGGTLPGGRVGELILDEGPEDPVGWVVAITSTEPGKVGLQGREGEGSVSNAEYMTIEYSICWIDGKQVGI